MKQYYVIMLISSFLAMHASEKNQTLSKQTSLQLQGSDKLLLSSSAKQSLLQKEAPKELNMSMLEDRLRMLDFIANHNTLNTMFPGIKDERNVIEEQSNRAHACLLFNTYAKLYMKKAEEEVSPLWQETFPSAKDK